MLSNILKNCAICSAILLLLNFGMNPIQASTRDKDERENTFVVNGEILTEDEYWAKIEALGVEVTDSMKRDKFIPEDDTCVGMNAEEFYNYISTLVEESDDIYVLGFTEVSEEEFKEVLSEDDAEYHVFESDLFDFKSK